jgi:hypothetical protein
MFRKNKVFFRMIHFQKGNVLISKGQKRQIILKKEFTQGFEKTN